MPARRWAPATTAHWAACSSRWAGARKTHGGWQWQGCRGTVGSTKAALLPTPLPPLCACAQAVLFLMLHTVPIALVFASLPALLRRLGQSPDVCALLRPYLLALLPAVWIDAVFRWLGQLVFCRGASIMGSTGAQLGPAGRLCAKRARCRLSAAAQSEGSWEGRPCRRRRQALLPLGAPAPAAGRRPFNRILLAQHVTVPQMWIGLVVAALHVPATHAFIHTLRFGSARATVAASRLLLPLLPRLLPLRCCRDYCCWRPPSAAGTSAPRTPPSSRPCWPPCSPQSGCDGRGCTAACGARPMASPSRQAAGGAPCAVAHARRSCRAARPLPFCSTSPAAHPVDAAPPIPPTPAALAALHQAFLGGLPDVGDRVVEFQPVQHCVWLAAQPRQSEGMQGLGRAAAHALAHAGAEMPQKGIATATADRRPLCRSSQSLAAMALAFSFYMLVNQVFGGGLKMAACTRCACFLLGRARRARLARAPCEGGAWAHGLLRRPPACAHRLPMCTCR